MAASDRIGTLRHEFVDALHTAIIDGISAETFAAQLDELSRRILVLLVRSHGRHEAEFLARRLLAETGDTGDDAIAQVEAGVARLVELGLFYRLFESEGAVRRTMLVMPDEIVASITAWLPIGQSLRPRSSVPAGDDAAQRSGARSVCPGERPPARSTRRTFTGSAGRPERTVAQIVSGLRSQTPDGPGEPARRWQFLLWVGKRVGWFGDDGWPPPDDERIALTPRRPSRSGAGSAVSDGCRRALTTAGWAWS